MSKFGEGGWGWGVGRERNLWEGMTSSDGHSDLYEVQLSALSPPPPPPAVILPLHNRNGIQLLTATNKLHRVRSLSLRPSDRMTHTVAFWKTNNILSWKLLLVKDLEKKSIFRWKFPRCNNKYEIWREIKKKPQGSAACRVLML